MSYSRDRSVAFTQVELYNFGRPPARAKRLVGTTDVGGAGERSVHMNVKCRKDHVAAVCRISPPAAQWQRRWDAGVNNAAVAVICLQSPVIITV
ncbi:hypothetical protein J6590_039145 [Homalodisca vitripennis]|nr:hypothetical protein J6590_039145 [Homalodisca vitripennis]